MATAIMRQSDTALPITLTNSVGTTGGFAFGPSAGAMLLVDSKSAGGSITVSFYVKAQDRLTDTYQLVDSSGAAVTQTVTAAGQCFPIPDGLFAAGYVMPVVSSGTAVVRVITKG